MKKRLVSLMVVLTMLCAFVPSLPAGAAANIKIGDYIQMGKYYGEPILWRCVDIDENGPLILSDKIICLKPFDAEASADSATGSHSRKNSRSSYGSNYWADSNMRSWLNSTANASSVNWLCGNPPIADKVYYNAYADEAGFLTHFSQGEINAMKAVSQKSIVSYPEINNNVYTTGSERHKSYLNIADVVANYDTAYAEYVTDKMFLMDVKQVNAVYNNRAVLGDDYYIGEPTAKAVANSEYKNEGYLEAEKKWYYWLRSPHVGSDSYTRGVSSDGFVHGSDAYIGEDGVRPAFYLDTVAFTIKQGIGTETNPYIGEGTEIDGTTESSGEITFPDDINNVTINYKGTAYGYFKATDNSGNTLKNKPVNYTIDDSKTKIATTDKDGYLLIKISNITESHDYKIAIEGNGIKENEGTLSVTVKPLEFTSTYEGKFGMGANIGVALDAGTELAGAEASVGLGSAAIDGNLDTALSMTQAYANNKMKLTLKATQGSKVGVSGKLGLAAKANKDGKYSLFEVSAGEASGKAQYGGTIGIGYEDDDFIIGDAEDAKAMAKFLIYAVLIGKEGNAVTSALNAAVLRIFGEPPVNIYENGATALLGTGATLGSVKVKNNPDDATASGGVDLFNPYTETSFIYSESTDSHDNNSYSSKITSKGGVNIGKLSVNKLDGKSRVGSSSGGWSWGIANNTLSLGAVRGAAGFGELSEISLTTENNDTESFALTSKSVNTKRTIKFKDDDAKALADNDIWLNNLSFGEKKFFSLSEMQSSMGKILASDAKGTYTEKESHKKSMSLPLSLGGEAGFKFGLNFTVAGSQSYDFEKERGLFENNTAYIQSESDIQKAVEDNVMTLGHLFDLANYEMAVIVDSCFTSVTEKLENAIQNGKAKIDKAADKVSDWIVSITRPTKTVNSMAILAVDNEISLFSTSSLATTIGEPYIISVTDTDGNDITDLSENPLVLTLEYDDAMLAEAGVSDINDVAVYYWDDDKCVYIRMGGTLNEIDKAMSLEITKTGQYILAVDNCPPAVTEFNVSDGGNSPEISAVVSDMSGIEDFSFSIDGRELVNDENLSKYYNVTTNVFTYPTTGFTAGTHTAVIYASDSAGNELSGGVTLEFTVSTDTPVIGNVTELDDEVTENIVVSATVASEKLSSVFLNIEEVDALGRGVRQSYEMVEENGIYTAEVEDIPESSMLNVWVSAYDTNGNEGKSDIQTILSVPDEATLIITNTANNSVKVKAVNCEDISSGKVLLAVYSEDGTLKSIYEKNFADEVVFDGISLTGSIKAMLWDNYNSMTPLAKAAELIN